MSATRKWFLKAAIPVVLVTAGLVLLGFVSVASTAAQHEEASSDSASPMGMTGLAPGTVPANVAPLITKWGRLCPALTPALLAAQLDQESKFDPHAESPAGAKGIAQFMPGTWAAHGIDGDGDGDRDIWDPKDAIPSAASYDCTLAEDVKHVPGNQTNNMLAAYNAGPHAVMKYNGVPPYAETQNYVKVIRQREKHFAASGAPTGGAGYTRPVNAAVTTGYRATGGQWSSGYHTGIDFAAEQGTPVFAAGGGRVVMAGYGVDGGAYGNTIVIQHPDGYFTQYAHLSSITVRDGQQVAPGTRIGTVGDSGTNSSGPHLHFEVRTGPNYGSDIDPVAFLRSKGVTL